MCFKFSEYFWKVSTNPKMDRMILVTISENTEIYIWIFFLEKSPLLSVTKYQNNDFYDIWYHKNQIIMAKKANDWHKFHYFNPKYWCFECFLLKISIFWVTYQKLLLHFFCILPIKVFILGIFSEKQLFIKLFL